MMLMMMIIYSLLPVLDINKAKDSNGLIRIMDRHPDDMELKNMVESYLQRLGGR